MQDKITEKLISIVGKDWVVKDPEKIADYLYDETPKPVSPKANKDVVVVKPKDTEQISEVLKLANKTGVPVIARGGGTGLCGAGVPTNPSILLSMERLNEIIDLDEDNLMVTCQAGVTLETLLEKVEETNDLFFPPHPGDEGAQIGGLVAENAGGARAVKHGVMRNYVKGLNLVWPTGEKSHLGGKVLKNNTGYSLINLLIGSEGTLGIITEATLRLYPAPKASATLIASFQDSRTAIGSVSQLLRRGITPLAVEYVKRDHIERSAEHLGENWPANKGNVDLIIIITGKDEDDLYGMGELISSVCEENEVVDILMAERSERQSQILDIRSNLYSTYQSEMAEDLDIAVPPARLAKFLEVIDQVSSEMEVDVPTWGHAGDGNLHLHILNKEGHPPECLEELKHRMYTEAIDLGGVISGEHGVGKIKVKDLSLMYNQKELELMKGVKNVFDPNGILNPGTAVLLDPSQKPG